MVELSGYTGNSLSSIRDRLLAAKEMKSSKPSTGRKYSVKYASQTLVTDTGFKMLNGGTTQRKVSMVEVSNVDDFEKFTVNHFLGKHKNPKFTKKDGKYTIFSKVGENNFHVDILEFSAY
jgi:hypothetical protein